MIAHVVLFRPRADVSAADRRALATTFERALREIPDVRRAFVGRRVTTGATYEQRTQPDFPYAAIIEFDDRDGLGAYLQHAAHAEPAQRFFDAMETGLILDYELADGRGLSASIEAWLASRPAAAKVCVKLSFM